MSAKLAPHTKRPLLLWQLPHHMVQGMWPQREAARLLMHVAVAAPVPLPRAAASCRACHPLCLPGKMVTPQ
jgi:hypothetical protein